MTKKDKNKYKIIYNEGQGFTEKKIEYKKLRQLIESETESKIFSNNVSIYRIEDNVKIY